MPRLARYSIRNRILFTIFLASLSIVLFLIWILSYEKQIEKQNIVQRMQAVAQLIASDAAGGLETNDPYRLQMSLPRIRIHMGIDTIYIFRANGDLFLADPVESAQSNPSGWISRRADFSEEDLHIVEPIHRNNQLLGSVYLRIPTMALNDRLKQHTFTIILSILAVLTIAVVLIFQVHRTISVPMNQLVQTIRDVPESASFQADSLVRKRDEISDLYSGFNKMLRKIERRDAQRDRAESALEESERRYRNLVESSPDAIFIQRNGQIIFINSAGAKLIGADSPGEIIGKDIYTHLARVPENRTGNFETKLMRIDGTTCDVDVTFIEITHDQEAAIQGIVRDVTERKQLREMAERMKRLAAVGELSAHIAHEIRNSIASLQVNLQNLAGHTDKGPFADKVIANMQVGIQRMGDTVKSILNFTKPNPPTMKKVPVQMVLDNALKMAEKELKESNITVHSDYDENCPELLMDPNQMQQAFLNLFRNSREAMPHGGTVSVRTRLHDEFVEVDVVDTGEGIPAKNIDRIFDPFFTTKREGTGLGLAFVARTLEQHGASIFVETDPHAGTKFSIRFPLEYYKAI